MDKQKKSIWPIRVLKYAREKYLTEKGNFLPLFFIRALTTFGTLVPAIYYKEMVDIISKVTPSQMSEWAHHAIAILFIIFWIKMANLMAYRISDFFLIRMSVNISKKIYLECFAYLQKHSYRFFSNNFTGALIKKVNKHVGSIDRISDILFLDISTITLNSLFILIVTGTQNIYLALILWAWLVIFMVVQYYLYKRNYSYEVLSNIRDSKVSGALSDAITNNFNIKIFASADRESALLEEVVEKRRKITRTKWFRAMVIRTSTAILTVILEMSIFFFAIQFREQGILSIGVFVLLQIYLFRTIDQMRSIGNIFRNLYQAFSQSAEMLEILDEKHEVQDTKNDILKIKQGTIAFNNVTFRYEENDNVFDNLSFKIKPGEKIALVGESGSWKTTVVKLLFRFFDIQWGSITIDGQDISQVTQDSLRESISMVPQDPVLFHRTLRENIAYGKPDATEEEIIAASKMARCHEFILRFPKWYETLVGERGIKLSGGERQRVAIARAILENKSILVLDEATSSLDSESEKAIQEAMEAAMDNKTVIIIAHRLSTIMKMDKIIVMDKGQISEQGSHKELLAKDKGIYKKLRDIQSGGFIE